MAEKTDWEMQAANLLKAELKRKGVTYAQLVERLGAGSQLAGLCRVATNGAGGLGRGCHRWSRLRCALGHNRSGGRLLGEAVHRLVDHGQVHSGGPIPVEHREQFGIVERSILRHRPRYVTPRPRRPVAKPCALAPKVVYPWQKPAIVKRSPPMC